MKVIYGQPVSGPSSGSSSGGIWNLPVDPVPTPPTIRPDPKYQDQPTRPINPRVDPWNNGNNNGDWNGNGNNNQGGSSINPRGTYKCVVSAPPQNYLDQARRSIRSADA